MKVITTYEELEHTLKNSRKLEYVVIRGVEIDEPLNELLQNLIVVRGVIFTECGFQGVGLSFLKLKVDQSISFLSCHFHEVSAYILNFHSGMISVYLRDCESSGLFYVCPKIERLVIENSEMDDVYGSEMDDTYVTIIHSKLGKFRVGSSTSRIVECLNFIDSKIETFKFLGMYNNFSSLGKGSNTLRSIFGEYTEKVVLDRGYFNDCDVSDISLDDVSVRENLTFDSCNVTNLDLSGMVIEKFHDDDDTFAINFESDCRGVESVIVPKKYGRITTDSFIGGYKRILIRNKYV